MTDLEILDKLKAEPLFLMQVVCSNNPQGVAVNLKSVNILVENGSVNPQLVLDALTGILPTASPEIIQQLMVVDYVDVSKVNPELHRAVMTRHSEIKKDVPINWGYMFHETTAKIPSSFKDFTASINKEPKEDEEEADTTQPQLEEDWSCIIKGQFKYAIAAFAVFIFVLFISKNW